MPKYQRGVTRDVCRYYFSRNFNRGIKCKYRSRSTRSLSRIFTRQTASHAFDGRNMRPVVATATSIFESLVYGLEGYCLRSVGGISYLERACSGGTKSAVKDDVTGGVSLSLSLSFFLPEFYYSKSRVDIVKKYCCLYYSLRLTNRALLSR